CRDCPVPEEMNAVTRIERLAVPSIPPGAEVGAGWNDALTSNSSPTLVLEISSFPSNWEAACDPLAARRGARVPVSQTPSPAATVVSSASPAFLTKAAATRSERDCGAAAPAGALFFLLAAGLDLGGADAKSIARTALSMNSSTVFRAVAPAKLNLAGPGLAG